MAIDLSGVVSALSDIGVGGVIGLLALVVMANLAYDQFRKL